MGTEYLVHVEVTWFPVCCAFDFRYATELVIVTHQLFILASARHDQKSLTIKVLMWRSKAFCSRRTSSRAAASVTPEPRGAAPSTSKITMSSTRERRFQARAICDCLIVFIERKHSPRSPTVSASLPQRSLTKEY